MTRRATILTALALLCMASGAMSKNKVNRTASHDGQEVYRADIQFDFIDTATQVSLDVATKVDDSLTFYSGDFGVNIPWTQVVCRVVVATPDTVFEDDTIGVALETKTDNPMDSTWRNLKVMTKIKESTINTNNSAWFRAYNDADTTAGNLYRFRIEYVVDEDSIRAHDQSGILPLNAKYQIEAVFRQRGNE